MPTLIHTMFPYKGFLPAAQSTQNHSPSGVLSTLTHSGWKAAGQDSQHNSVPPCDKTIRNNSKRLKTDEQIYMNVTNILYTFCLTVHYFLTVTVKKKIKMVLHHIVMCCITFKVQKMHRQMNLIHRSNVIVLQMLCDCSILYTKKFWPARSLLLLHCNCLGQNFVSI